MRLAISGGAFRSSYFRLEIRDIWTLITGGKIHMNGDYLYLWGDHHDVC